MNTVKSGSTAQVPKTLGVYAIGGVEESSVAAAASAFAEVRKKSAWRDAYNLANQYLEDDEREGVTEAVLALLVGELEPNGRRFGAFSNMEDLARSLNCMFTKAEGPFFVGKEKWYTDGDESYTALCLSWLPFWQFPSHADDILHDLGIAGQIVLTLFATCPHDVDDLFCDAHLRCDREDANIFGELPEIRSPYGSLESPAVEAWIVEVLK